MFGRAAKEKGDKDVDRSLSAGEFSRMWGQVLFLFLYYSQA